MSSWSLGFRNAADLDVVEQVAELHRLTLVDLRSASGSVLQPDSTTPDEQCGGERQSGTQTRGGAAGGAQHGGGVYIASGGSRSPPATTTRAAGRPDSISSFSLDERDRPLAPVEALGPQPLAQAVEGMGGLGPEGHRHLAAALGPASTSSQPVTIGIRSSRPSAAPLEDPVRRRDLLDHGLHPQPRLGDPEAGRRSDPAGLEPLEPKLA